MLGRTLGLGVLVLLVVEGVWKTVVVDPTVVVVVVVVVDVTVVDFVVMVVVEMVDG